MAFNVTSFFGGMAKGGSKVLTERRDQSRRDKETAEQRQWTIATEARADARTRKQNRLDKKSELDELIQEASLYFDSGDIPRISASGKVGLRAAITRAQELAPYNITGSDLFKLPSINSIDDMPKGEDVAKNVPLMSSLVGVPAGREPFKGNYEQFRVHKMQELTAASSTEEKEQITTQLLEIDSLIKANKDGGFDDNAIINASKSVNHVVDTYFKDANRLEIGAKGEYLKRLNANEAVGLQLMGRAYADIMSNPAYEGNAVLQGVVTQKMQNLDGMTRAFVNDAQVKHNKYQTALSDTTTNADVLAGLKADAGNFISLNPADPMTMQDINNGAWRVYEPNTVIQVQDETGQYSFVITTGQDIIKL